MISKKPIANAPKGLQRLLLRLQRYDITVVYKKGSEMFLANTLSRAYLKTKKPVPGKLCPDPEDASSFWDDFEVNLTGHLPISGRLMEIRAASANDPSMKLLSSTIREGWPEKRDKMPREIQAYFNHRDKLTVQDGLLFKRSRIIIPTELRCNMVGKIHDSYIGIEGCLRRAREVFYWPNMNGEIKDHISRCDICNTLKAQQQREPLIPHEPPTRPWARVDIDLLDFEGQTYVIMVDYYSNFWEIKSLERSSTATRSSIGAESSLVDMDTCKRLMRKAKPAKRDIYLIMLDWRTTPSEGLQTFPAQRLMGRRTRTLLHTHESLLEPIGGSKEIHANLKQAKEKQAKYFNRNSKPLPELKPDGTIRMRLPGEDSWSKGKVLRKAGTR